MKTRDWKRYKAKEPLSPEVRRARVWIAIVIGIGCGWAMAAATNLIAGIAVGCLFAFFLLIRRGRM